MTEVWESFDLEPVPEVDSLDRATFESEYRGIGPVIVRGGARGTPAFERWDPDYIAREVGAAEVSVATYPADRRDYSAITQRKERLADFIAELADGRTDEVRYLFNNQSCIFIRNEDQPRFHTGWGSATNPGLQALATDFRVPAFVDPRLFVLAVIIIGSQENATDLHYDNGGEGKVLVQLRGRKRLMLLPPSAAEDLRLYSIFHDEATRGGRAGSRPQVDVHAPSNGHAAPRLSGYEAEIRAGDIAYWPSFWFHDLANLDPFTVAAGVMVDENRINALLLRHLTHGVFRELIAAAKGRNGAALSGDPGTAGDQLRVSLDGSDLGSLGDLFRDVETRLIDEARAGTSFLWEWNQRLKSER